MADQDVFFGPSADFARVFKKALFVDLKVAGAIPMQEETRFKFMEEEPIFAQILHNMVLGQSFVLQTKARIKIRDSAVLIGVVDKEGILEPGEIFCQIERGSFRKLHQFRRKHEKQKKSVKKIMDAIKPLKGDEHRIVTVEGTVIVNRNPCCHPGDIRLLKAVGKCDPRYNLLGNYYKYVNVVVFPSKGEIPV